AVGISLPWRAARHRPISAPHKMTSDCAAYIDASSTAPKGKVAAINSVSGATRQNHEAGALPAHQANSPQMAVHAPQANTKISIDRELTPTDPAEQQRVDGKDHHPRCSGVMQRLRSRLGRLIRSVVRLVRWLRGGVDVVVRIEKQITRHTERGI